MNEYTDRRNDSDNWECPCPYRDRCERFASRNNRSGCESNYREGQNGSRRNTGACGNRRSGCSICNLFRRCN